MIGSNDCGNGCKWCDGSCQYSKARVPSEREARSKSISEYLENSEPLGVSVNTIRANVGLPPLDGGTVHAMANTPIGQVRVRIGDSDDTQFKGM